MKKLCKKVFDICGVVLIPLTILLYIETSNLQMLLFGLSFSILSILAARLIEKGTKGIVA